MCRHEMSSSNGNTCFGATGVAMKWVIIDGPWCFNPMDKWGTLSFGRWLFLTYWSWESIKPWIIAIEPFRWWPPELSHFLRTQNLFFKCNHCSNGIHDSCFHFDYICLLCRMWQWQVTMKPYKIRMPNKIRYLTFDGLLHWAYLFEQFHGGKQQSSESNCKPLMAKLIN